MRKSTTEFIAACIFVFSAILMADGGADCGSAPTINIPGDLPYSDTGTTCGKGDTYDNNVCTTYYDSGEDAIYILNVTAAGTYDFAMTSSATYSAFHVTDDCPDVAMTCLGGSESSGTSESASIAFSTTGTYYLHIDTWSTPDCTDFSLSITPPPPPPLWVEDFEAGIPGIWTTWDRLGASGFNWVLYSTGSTIDASYRHVSDWAIANSDATGSGSSAIPYDCVLCSPQLDISGVTDPQLVADISFRDVGNSAFEVWTSCDNGASGYSMIDQYLSSQTSTTETYDLSGCAGATNFVVCFRFYNLTDGYDYYANVDNVGIDGSAGSVPAPTQPADDPSGSVPVELKAFSIE